MIYRSEKRGWVARCIPWYHTRLDSWTFLSHSMLDVSYALLSFLGPRCQLASGSTLITVHRLLLSWLFFFIMSSVLHGQENAPLINRMLE
ncbi:hypothetical protein BDV26DRAFT_15407 [Aspergillus bertholletiae]|uniref:Uncharacterized protein n=1 Tax=Aspergillus bertholletiae TaxID=1226010 RepID=A0A5N7BKI7_9EURO|nr:hypothetical protein BDV26DRAFT_15407 [Aspergillus bertholletiae]